MLQSLWCISFVLQCPKRPSTEQRRGHLQSDRRGSRLWDRRRRGDHFWGCVASPLGRNRQSGIRTQHPTTPPVSVYIGRDQHWLVDTTL